MKAWEATVRKTQAAARRRANSIFGTPSTPAAAAQATEEEEGEEEGEEDEEQQESNGGAYHAERFLPNGDYYNGYWWDNFPHGYGKYWWTDGCMYVGEWFRGKTTGRGMFSWPSGAMYEGDFRSNHMDGQGTYTGANGDTYKGSWLMSLQHGHGVKEYSNGDLYDGNWFRGLQEGHGKYQWNNSNSSSSSCYYYVGEWKNGSFSGQGKMVWVNGNIYEGNLEDGFPKGSGKFSWPDGSFYVGNWNKDPKEQNGNFYPSEALLEVGNENNDNMEWDPQEVFAALRLKESKICPSEMVTMLPSHKKLAVWRSTKGGDSGMKPRRMSVDGRIDAGVDKEFSRMRMFDYNNNNNNPTPSSDMPGRHSVGGRDLEDALMSGLNLDEVNTRGGPLRIPRVIKRQGEAISKGHKNYDLMLNLQLGIRHSVGRAGPPASLDLKASAFDPKEKYWTRFPPEGSKYTPPHPSVEFRWKDYCPLVFRTLRLLFKVDAADYMLSICGNDTLREFSSPGKSGSFFYLTHDDRYMIKTMKKAEVKVVLRMLNAYYNHVRAFENTLVIKYYGLHCLRLNGPSQKKVRFIIMGNLLCTDYTIHRKFDLKGSSLGRMTGKPEAELDANTILKDLDLNFIFRLQKNWFQDFRRQIDKDCEFLEQERIMDYSLLVGIHFREITNTGEVTPTGCLTPVATDDSLDNDSSVPRLSRADMDQLLSDPAGWASIGLGVNMPARVERTERRTDCEFQQLVGEPTGEFYDVMMFFGIIDILQDYDITKKLEHAYKSIQYDPNSISAVDPRQYSRRFRDFIFKVFAEDT